MELFRTASEDFLLSSAASSMWTWLAVLTAAVGLWRIRSFGYKHEAPSSISPSRPRKAPFEKASVFRSIALNAAAGERDTRRTKVLGTSPDAEAEERKSFAISECSDKSGSATGLFKELRRREPTELMSETVEQIPRTKRRFTMVFSFDSAEDGCDCGGIDCDETPEEEEEEERVVVGGGGDADGELLAPSERSERMGSWVRKRSEFDWYCYQDRMAINGSVVRLWCGRGCRGRMGIYGMGSSYAYKIT